MGKLATILDEARGQRSIGALARDLELSYTFVRSVLKGTRHPSDEVLVRIAGNLGLEPDELLIAAYCDRSPSLASALARRGLRGQEGRQAATAPQTNGAPQPTSSAFSHAS